MLKDCMKNFRCQKYDCCHDDRSENLLMEHVEMVMLEMKKNEGISWVLYFPTVVLTHSSWRALVLESWLLIFTR